MQHYPFRFKLDDCVRVSQGQHEGKTGTVKALELSENRTIAVIEVWHPERRSLRFSEEVLEAA